MKVKLKLKESVDKKLERGEKWSYVWIPTLDRYKDLIKLSVKDTKFMDTTGDLMLPTAIGDVISMELIKKESQSSLKPDRDKGKK